MRYFLILAFLILINCQDYEQDFNNCIMAHIQTTPHSEELIRAIETNNYEQALMIIFSHLPEFAEIFFKCLKNPDIETDLEELRELSEKYASHLFGIKVSLKAVPFEQEVILYNKDPIIKAKLVSSCDYTLHGSTSGFLTFENGYIIDKSGITFNIVDSVAELIKKLTGFDIKDMSYNFEYKLKNGVQDGTVSFKYSLQKLEVQLATTFKGKKIAQTGCAGTLIITITKRHSIQIDERTAEAIRETVKCGIIVVLVLILIALCAETVLSLGITLAPPILYLVSRVVPG